MADGARQRTEKWLRYRLGLLHWEINMTDEKTTKGAMRLGAFPMPATPKPAPPMQTLEGRLIDLGRRKAELEAELVSVRAQIAEIEAHRR